MKLAQFLIATIYKIRKKILKLSNIVGTDSKPGDIRCRPSCNKQKILQLKLLVLEKVIAKHQQL